MKSNFSLIVVRNSRKATTPITRYASQEDRFLSSFLIFEQKFGERCTVQSFDVRVLNYLHVHFPQQKLVYLVENNADYVAALKLLNFKPDVYSCDYTLLSKSIVTELHKQNIKVIPWTVNEVADIQTMLTYEVDGLISDYPDKVIPIVFKF